jgi:hypothetical protein
MLAGLQKKLAPTKPEVERRSRRKAVGLIYGRDDMPPLGTLGILGLQHAIESASKVTLPVAVLLALGADQTSMQTMISATLIFTGICSIVVSTRNRTFGFGHLTPSAIITSFVAPSMIAMQVGGLKLLAGMTLLTGADATPELAAQMPEVIRPLLSSGLTVATVMVVFLNALFHLGTSRKQQIRLAPNPDSIDSLCEFIEDFAAQWGARREVASRAVSAMVEFFESLISNDWLRWATWKFLRASTNSVLILGSVTAGRRSRYPQAVRRSPSTPTPPTFSNCPATCFPDWRTQ